MIDKTCVICHSNVVKHDKNFQNLDCCSSCKDFYRRTIKELNIYKCRRGSGTCAVNKENAKTLCSYCRFKKCIQKGMDKAVAQFQIQSMVNFISEFDNDFFMNKLAKTRNLIEFNRMHLSRNGPTLSIFGKFYENMNQLANISMDEMLVLDSFLEYIGFADIVIPFYKKENIIRECNASWIIFELIYVNLRQGCSHSGILYYVDGNFFKINEDYMASLYGTDPCAKNCNIVASHGMNTYVKIFELIKRFRDIKIESIEYTFLMILTIANIAISKCDNSAYIKSKLNPYINMLFKSFSKFCAQKDTEFTTRLDELIILYEKFQSMIHDFSEHLTMVKLSGYSSKDYGYYVWPPKI